MMNYMYGDGGRFLSQGGGLAFMIIQLLFWIAIIYIAVRLINRYMKRQDHLRAKADAGMSILRERFAKGEIDDEEFKKRKAELE